MDRANLLPTNTQKRNKISCLSCKKLLSLFYLMEITRFKTFLKCLQNCGKDFRDSKKLSFHVQTVHLKETFKCKVCNRSFHAKRLLRSHVKNVHDHERPRLKCFHCDVSVHNQTISLRKHFLQKPPVHIPQIEA